MVLSIKMVENVVDNPLYLLNETVSMKYHEEHA